MGEGAGGRTRPALLVGRTRREGGAGMRLVGEGDDDVRAGVLGAGGAEAFDFLELGCESALVLAILGCLGGGGRHFEGM